MEKFDRPKLEELPALKQLEDNWQQWGEECKAGERSWRSSGKLYKAIRKELEVIAKDHCSFCDDKPLGVKSTQTIEHYFPKGKDDFPCLTFAWENLFYCCNKCQLNANSDKPFKYTLKPDNEAYFFQNCFYYDQEFGELKILENLASKNPEKFEKATAFLKRYGLKDGKLKQVRINKFKEVFRELKDDDDTFDKRIRDDFAFRYVYDAAKAYFDNWKKSNSKNTPLN